MAKLAAVGAMVDLDSARTDEQFLGVRIALFAELDDARRIEVDSGQWKVGGPRRGVGALWGYITVDPETLPTLNRELFARDTLAAATQALESSFQLGPEHLDQFVRTELFPGSQVWPGHSDADGLEGSVDHVDSSEQLTNLVLALRRAGVAATTAELRDAPFQVELSRYLILELER